MDLTEKNIKRLTLIILTAIFIILAIIIIWPIMSAVFGGLLLAYITFPIYSWLYKLVKSKNISAAIVLLLFILIIVLPIWFLAPKLTKEVFNIFTLSQKIDIQSIVQKIFPASTEEFIVQSTVTLNSIISKASSALFNFLMNLFLDIPKILLGLFIAGFVFFFALRDYDKLKEFVKRISPFSEDREKEMTLHFKDMTDSIVYGQVIAGIVQGLVAGLGFFIFGIENALLLTILAILLSIVPILGPAFIWIPITIYLLASGDYARAILYFLYNLIIVSTVDNIVRSYFVSKRTKVSPAVILVGMLGGLLVFGLLGLVIGPLILSYLVTIIETMRNKSVYKMFSE